MFKKYYKQANDDIKTNRELIDKIFEAAEKPSKTVKFSKVYKIGTAVAAVFVFAAGAILYPHITKLNDVSNLPANTGQVIEEKKLEPVTKEVDEQKPQKEKSVSVKQQENPVVTANEPAPENAAEGENPEITAAMDTEAIKPFSIPEGHSGRMIDAPPVADTGEIPIDSFEEIEAEETERVQQFLRATFGEKDEETNNIYLFGIAGKAENMYLGRWSWLVDEHSSLLCEFVLNEELTEMYECTYTEDGAVQWNTQNNILDR